MRALTLLFCIAIFANIAFPGSIEILPAIVSFDFVPPGFVFDMEKKAGVSIMIPNDNNVRLQYSIALSNAKNPGSLLPGYENFPDVSWCKIIPDTAIWVEANDTGRINLVFKIPEEPRYYNQYWELGVSVEAKQGLEVKSGGVSLGIIPSIMGSYLISTSAKEGINPIDKPTGIVPSAAWLKTDEAIKGKNLTFTIYNNDKIAHEYVIEPYTFPKFEWYDVRLAIQNLGDSKPGEDSWVKTAKGFLFFKSNKVRIESGKTAEWTVKVAIPNTKDVKEAPGWDLVVKVLPEGNKEHSGIFRIVIEK